MIKKIVRLECKCNRCGKEWISRSPDKPKLCPNHKCHTPFWDEDKPKRHRSKKRLVDQEATTE